MNYKYIFQKPVRHSRYSAFRRNMKLIIVVVAALVFIGVFIFSNLYISPKPPPKAFPEKDSTVTSQMQTFSSPYFKFQDTGKWVLDQKDSTASKYLYTNYNGQIIEGQLVVYVNQEPVPASTTRVLPVRIVNSNSFQITGVSDPCASQYAKGELHRVKEVSIHDALMVCDPDDPQYSAILSEIGSDYHLHLTRADGARVQIVLIYRNQDLDPRPNNLLNIASTFQTL